MEPAGHPDRGADAQIPVEGLGVGRVEPDAAVAGRLLVDLVARDPVQGDARAEVLGVQHLPVLPVLAAHMPAGPSPFDPVQPIRGLVAGLAGGGRLRPGWRTPASRPGSSMR
jgi:hypothetical protein